MSYKRLTERTKNNGIRYCKSKLNNHYTTVYPKGNEDSYLLDDIDKLAIRLAELEDKIERGELVENKVVTYVNMARSNSKTLIDKALKYDELKAKIENGTLIELPCKVGDTIYEINSCSDKVNETKARHLWDILRWKQDNLFGRWLFTNKAEAEKKLEEIKGGAK